jgi:hypothetical protein
MKTINIKKSNSKTRKLLIFIFLIIFPLVAFSAIRPEIGKINIIRKNVFDSTQSDWFFAASLANSLHMTTQEYFIEDELLFSEEDYLSFSDLYETERNLRNTGLFTNVSIKVDSLNPYVYDVYVITQDRWSTMPVPLFGTGGNTTRYGGRIEELNLFGTGTYVALEALHRSENNIGWEGAAALYQRRLFRTDFSLDFSILSHQYRTDQFISVYDPFHNLSDKSAYGAAFWNSFGSEFLYNDGGYELMNFHERRAKAWVASAWKNIDRVFFTVLLDVNNVNRGKPEYMQAFDNSGKFLLGFSSVAERYKEETKLNTYQIEDLPEGGWGQAILGRIFALGSGNGGETMFYLGGQAEKSWVTGDLYFLGHLAGGSGFSTEFAKYTYQEFYGLSFYRITDNLLIAGRVWEQAVWNWPKLRQLVLDNDFGLRGYSANFIAGDNRMVGNLELRYFPDIPFWIFNLSGALFWDFGSAWDQDTHITKTRWHNSAGFGIRFHNEKAAGDDNVLRIDFAFNFDDHKFAEIIFSSGQLFSIFKKHTYLLPTVLGLDFDYE